MADNPYNELGVPRSASDDEIRKAYRKLAKQFHPDLNPTNRKQAEERIKSINGAFAILGDPEKRRQYDAGLIDANGDPRQRGPRANAGAGRRPAAAGADDFGFGDIFADLFGRAGRAGGGPGPGQGFGGGQGFAGHAGPSRGDDARYTLEVDFLEAALGAKKRVTMPDGAALDLTVPEGVVDGQTLRLKGKGHPGPRGTEAGDALVEIKVRPHPYFTRKGDDIHATVPITLDEAVLGGKIEVDTISGRVALTIPKGTSSGRQFRLKGKGVRPNPMGQPGDQIVTIGIEMPAEIDDQLSYFMTEWRRTKGYKVTR